MSRDQRAGAGGPLSRATKGIGSLIGLATEAHAHHKEKKAAEQGAAATKEPPAYTTSQDSGLDHEEPDDEDWALDDASVELSTSGKYEDGHLPSKAPMSSILGAGTLPSSIKPLPCPVILPQRRPQSKSRGFVRAYAPILGEYKGIDEATFLQFLDEFYKSSQASPWIQAVNVAAMVVGSVPSPIAMAVSMSTQAAAKAATEVQGRMRTNSYLDQINETFFHQRNLHCMVMTFKPDQTNQEFVEIDVNAANAVLAKSLDGTSKMGKLKGSSGTSKGEFSIPEAAPLIYPTIDKATSAMAADGKPLSAEKQNAMKRSGAFISDYIDRRSQAEYAGVHGEDSKLAIPGATEQNFASRYADPNHPANSGSLMALLTGGTFDPRSRRRGRFADMRAGRHGQELSEQEKKNMAMGRGAPSSGPRGMIRRGVKKVVAQDVLYLLIAEMPSQQAMEEMRREMEGKMEG